MSITAIRKQEVMKEFAKKSGDVGSSEVQIAVLTERIKNLTAHLRIHKKDFHTRHGLLAMVCRRRKLLNYLKAIDNAGYLNILQRLSLRK